MSKAVRNWSVNPRNGNLTLSMEVQVNGETLRADSTAFNPSGLGGPPPDYLERSLRSQLMQAIEERLLGPRP